MWQKLWILNILLVAGCSNAALPSAAPTAGVAAAASDESGLTEFLAADPNAALTPAALTLIQDHKQNALALLRAFVGESNSTNTVFSPYITAVGLEMLYAGAQGSTQQEMATALSSHLNPAEMPGAQRVLTQVLINGLAASPNTSLHTGTRVWLQDGLARQGDYESTLSQSFGARPGLVDFEAHADQALADINGWVQAATAGQISQLLQSGDVTADTRLMLAAALFLQARWTTSFVQDTATTPFNCADGSQKPVPLLRLTQGYAYAADANYQAIEVPYDQGDFSMLVVMPKTQTLSQFLKSLDSDALGSIDDALSFTQVDLAMPPFAYDNSHDLRSALQALGMKAAFDPHTADFGGITAQIPLYVSKAMEQAQIAVDENGTQASAAAAVVMAKPTIAAANPATFTVDQPFLWIIRDRRAHEPLLMGVVAKP